MLKKLLSAVAFGLVAMTAGQAMAQSVLPRLYPPDFELLDKMADIGWQPGLSDVAYLWGTDNRTVFVPYDTVELASNSDGTPAFGFAYDTQGARVNIMVKAAYSQKAQQYIQLLQSKGRIVRPLQPTSGGWVLHLNYTSPEGDLKLAMRSKKSIDKNDTLETVYTNTVFPTMPIALTADLSQRELALVITSFKTGAGIGVSYHYIFPATVDNYRFNATIDWTRFETIAETIDIKTSEKCKKGSAGVNLGLFHVGGSNSKCSVDYADVRNMVRTLIDTNDITIKSLAGEQFTRQVDMLTNLVLAAKFEPEPSIYKPANPFSPKSGCDQGGTVGGLLHAGASLAPGIGAYQTGCRGNAHAYFKNDYSDFQSYSLEYNVVSEGIVEKEATVSGFLNNFCDKFPNYFVHIGTGVTGCPTEVSYDRERKTFVIGVDGRFREVGQWGGQSGDPAKDSPPGKPPVLPPVGVDFGIDTSKFGS